MVLQETAPLLPGTHPVQDHERPPVLVVRSSLLPSRPPAQRRPRDAAAKGARRREEMLGGTLLLGRLVVSCRGFQEGVLVPSHARLPFRREDALIQASCFLGLPPSYSWICCREPEENKQKP